MKESINEHDMTKKMMSIMRGGYKPLLKEQEQEEEQEEEKSEITSQQKYAKPPKEGRPALGDRLDSSYFEMDKDDYRYKGLSKQLTDRVSQARITSVYIAYPKGLVINGVALDNAPDNTGLYFTLNLADPTPRISSENVQGDLSMEVQDSLTKFWEAFLADSIGNSQYLYNDKDDKQAKEANEEN
jgi:hypothetical protein